MKRFFLIFVFSLFLLFPYYVHASNYAGVYSGTYSGNDRGKWIAVVASSGHTKMVIYSIGYDEMDGFSGYYVQDSGSLSAITMGDRVAINLLFSLDGRVSGTWVEGTSSGSATGTKQNNTSQYTGNYSGTLSGADYGTWNLSIDSSGVISGSGVSNYVGSFIIDGAVDDSGFFMCDAGVAGVKGQISGNFVSGSWYDEGIAYGGPISGDKLDIPPLTTFYRDSDGDGYGNPNLPYESNQQLPGYVTDNTDCNDDNSSIHPGATEIGGDWIDQNCDGSDQTTQQLVTEIYVATFGRAPAYAGLNYWVESVDTGSFTIEQVAQSFFDQPETKEKFPEGSSNPEFISTIFYNVLNRAPAEAGLTYWVDALDSGAVRRDQAIMAIINGAKSETGSSEDAAMLAKKTEIGVYFAHSEVGSMTDNGNFMDWATNVISFAASDDFNLEEAEEYISGLY